MTVAVENILGPMKGARLLLASCATFQAIVGAASATAALPFIKLFEAVDTVDLRPRAIIPAPQDWKSGKQGDGSFDTEGNLLVCIEASPQDVLSRQLVSVPTNFMPDSDYFTGSESPGTEELLVIFGKWIGNIIKESQVLAAAPSSSNPSQLNAVEFALHKGPARSNAAMENGADFCWAKLRYGHVG